MATLHLVWTTEPIIQRLWGVALRGGIHQRSLELGTTLVTLNDIGKCRSAYKMSIKPLLSFVISSLIGIILLDWPLFFSLYGFRGGWVALYCVGIVLFAITTEMFGFVARLRFKRVIEHDILPLEKFQRLPRYGRRWTARSWLAFFGSLTAAGFAFSHSLQAAELPFYLALTAGVMIAAFVFDRGLNRLGVPPLL